MAMLLAPYNEAMRRGMGFNSFTQQLCINDAVRPAGKTVLASKTTVEPQSGDGGSVDISQAVSWSADFVDHISEVTDRMNVSSALQIKRDAVGGGGIASAFFIETKKFKESDINYLIRVTVTKQRLVAPDLTEFHPVEGLPDSEFTRVYGDSFISGFTEGGELTALVSIKLDDRSKTKEVRRQLQIDLNPQLASVSGERDLMKTGVSSNIDGETTIAVSWRGGGDMKDGTDVRSLETLKKVVMKFPEHAMACPMRTNAILTKYTSLKSFYGITNKSKPLDYEIAGVYTSALLDAYTDYKVMWRNIQAVIREVEQGQSELEAKNDIPELAGLSQEAKANHDDQLMRYKDELSKYEHTQSIGSVDVAEPPPKSSPPQPSLLTGLAPALFFHSVPAPALVITSTVPQPFMGSSSTSSAMGANPPPPEPPLPPIDLVPYKADILGLAKAQRDCRFEMIKIVREVDAMANDPKVACDPTRTFQHLNPAVFRMLLPAVRSHEKERAARLAAEEAKKLSEERDKLEDELTTTKSKLETTEERLRAVDAAKEEIDPWDGCCPAPEGSPIRFITFVSGKALDVHWSGGTGDRRVHQYDIIDNNTNQKWIICRAGGTGYLIRHPESGHYLAIGNQVSDDSFHMTVHDLGSVFIFEPRGNSGTYYIHLAEHPRWTLNLLGGGHANGVRIGVYSGSQGDCDAWSVNPWDDR